MKDADLVVLLGARLNWMLHFGKPPRFANDVKIVQVLFARIYKIQILTWNYIEHLNVKVDLQAEELGNNTNTCIQVQADIRSFCQQVNKIWETKQ